jgi:hypothetical protein
MVELGLSTEGVFFVEYMDVAHAIFEFFVKSANGDLGISDVRKTRKPQTGK